ncbi:MutS-related protein [Butyrivibrio sp. YAB3001]|uniref:MutS-related protein n=1 Tax=Butyrivibrio sp. YAB3001 TaxID=1520812 RepID=UPI0008F63CDB|nr:hypothetical protein [Butyrivibrio sp. YAB3001]SFB68346.1 MutS domain V [Butyrivibrio sp. YAB3001]
MESIILISILVGICFIAYLLGLRDQKIAEKALLIKLKKNSGQAPFREYKQDDLDHIPGFYNNHKSDNQIDDITWNDLNMDGVFARINYCLSATGEEYLYYLLRTLKQEDDFKEHEEHVKFFQSNADARQKCQLIFYKIGRRIRYSIYDYIDYLDRVPDVSNAKHFIMLGLMVISGAVCFVNFKIGFIALLGLMAVNLVWYFRQKGTIEPYLATFAYILRVIYATDYFDKIKYPELEKDIKDMKDATKALKSFVRGAGILMTPGGSASGNPMEVIFDYFRMVTHIDLIKFNQMYKAIIAHREDLDKILEITGRIEAEISVACFRESVKDNYCEPVFGGEEYNAKVLLHPLIENAVPNDIAADRGVLITGSNASGKSTFLKTCAINTILAQTIHTVLAKEYKAPIYKVYSSMALKDDIFEGDSYYIVEIKSIKRILDAAKKDGFRVLCFVDEVLRGTNTIERIAASTEILKTFAKEKVMCFAATHDIELTTLLADYYGIYHFEGNVSDNDVHFDYLIKEGPATTRNAIKLLGVLGYDNEVVDNAQHLADHFLKNGVWV